MQLMFGSLDGTREKLAHVAASCTDGEMGAHSHTLTFLHRSNHGQRRSLLALSCAALGMGDAAKVKVQSLPSPMHANSPFPSPSLSSLYFIYLFFCSCGCWNFSVGNLYKGSLTCGWLFMAGVSRDSWTPGECGWSWFVGYCRVHSWDLSLPNTWHMGMWNSWIFWHVVLDPRAPTKGLLPVDGCQFLFLFLRWRNHEVCLLQQFH